MDGVCGWLVTVDVCVDGLSAYSTVSISLCLPVFPSVQLSMCLIFVWLITPELLNHFKNKFGMVVYYHEAECHAEKTGSVFKVKVTLRIYKIKI